MTTKTIQTISIAAVLGTLATSLWGMVFWGFLYEPVGVFQAEPLNDEIAIVLESETIDTGTYFFPWPRNTPETQQTWVDKHTAGPFFRLSYVREGVNPQSAVKLLSGTAQIVVVAATVASLIVLVLRALPSFQRRVAFVIVAGCMGTFMTWGTDRFWFHMPIDYAFGHVVYEIGSWLILSVVCGIYITPKRIDTAV